MRFADAVLHDLKNLSADRICESDAVIRRLYKYLHCIALRRYQAGEWPVQDLDAVLESVSYYEQLLGDSVAVPPHGGEALRRRLVLDYQGVPGRIASRCVWPFKTDGSLCNFATVLIRIARLLLGAQGGECFEARVRSGVGGGRLLDLLGEDGCCLKTLPVMRLAGDDPSVSEWYVMIDSCDG